MQPSPPGSSRSVGPPPTISFFAAAAAAFALGALVSENRAQQEDGEDLAGVSVGGLEEMAVDDGPGVVRRSSRERGKRLSPAYLSALSAQALSVHETSATFDLDYLVACILQVLLLLHGGLAAGVRATGAGVDGPGRAGKRKSRKTQTSAGGTLFPLVSIVPSVFFFIPLPILIRSFVCAGRENGEYCAPDGSRGRPG